MTMLMYIFIGLLAVKLVAELVLDWLNRRYVQSMAREVPNTFKTVMDLETYGKATAYTLAKNSFGIFETFYDAAILLLIILSGLLPLLYQNFAGWLGVSLWGQGAILLAMTVVLSLPSLPVQWWSQFVLEEKFGFNKSTLRLWVTDKIKGLLLGIALGYPLICLLLGFFAKLPETWWIWAFIALFVFQLLMLVLYPRLILPLFNKLQPLAEGELRDRLLRLADRSGFHASAIYVMDGSKRSSHSNAFFTGFGRFRRIVLFDTLVEQLTAEELEAVLAHEIGHYKLGHVPKRLALSALYLLGSLALIAWLVNQPWFITGFGFPADLGEARVVPALILFTLLSGLITFWVTPLMSSWSRKHEYEADTFAKQAVGSPDPLIHSLRKMHKENLSNLTPHPLYSAFHYSHPTLLERETALNKD